MQIGGQAVTVTSLGRYCAQGNSLSHELRLIQRSNNGLIASATVSMSGCTEGQTKYATLASPVTLSPNTAYVLVSYEVGADKFHDYNGTTLTTTSVATVVHGIYTTDGGQTWGAAGSTGNSYVPVDFQYTTGGTAEISYLVSDQLGTPRMVFDQSGDLTTTKRHDYAPFGEELFNGARTTAMGYAVGDLTRQRFTKQERDIETGLDYFLARYYSSTQGRFTAVDSYDVNLERQQAQDETEAEALFSKFVKNPQRWNSYTYALNNPVRFLDPNGQDPQDGLELNLRRDEKALLEGKISEQEFRDRMTARGVGAVAGLVFLATAYLGEEAAVTIMLFASRNPDQIEQIAMDLTMASTGSPAPGNPGTLTLSGTTRLTVAEANTGARLASQLGEHLTESTHVGAEFVSAAGKTFDAMGTPQAYANWNTKEFTSSIVRHLNKSVDYVAIDLTGASKGQIKAIKSFVGGLTEAQQKKIIYVQ
jgi:RHS repeat-associated protein